MSTLAGVNHTTLQKVFGKASESSKLIQPNSLLNTKFRHRKIYVRSGTPDRLSDKMEESLKKAAETCSEDPVSSECAGAWDEVEELSAAASHARDRNKESDPLEAYCKDNPETDECRTYDN